MSEVEHIENSSKEIIPETIDAAVEKVTIEVVEEEEIHESIDYSLLDAVGLIEQLKVLVKEDDIKSIRLTIEEIKTLFYKNIRAQFDQEKQNFIDEGGVAEDFVFSNSLENEFKELYGDYKAKRDALKKQEEIKMAQNLEKRKELIEKLSKLINTEESLNKTFQVFREIQEEWKEIGQVPASVRKSIWETYHLEVGKFYDYLNINKELRDLDLKKNFEAKTILCEKAEALTLEEKVVKAFAKLQLLHEQWQEIGPVQRDVKDELWSRFKSATTKINKAHQDYFSNLKEQEATNLESKIALCEKIEELNLLSISNLKTWKKITEEVTNIQKVWKTIGFAPQKNNAKVYERFSAACDKFFENKREFFAGIRDIENENKQQKIQLCMQAESMINRTDWAEASRDYVKLQKQWKEVGPVSQKDSNKLWNRFRSACDAFFKAKQKHQKNLQSAFVENLEKKKEVLSRLQKFTVGTDVKESLKEVQVLQKEWAEIGRVPESGMAIQDEYKQCIQDVFSQLQLPEDQKKDILFKLKVESLANQNDNKKIYVEESKLLAKLKTLQADIDLLENNIGFFAKSKNANKVIADINKKIENGRTEIDRIKEQLTLIQTIQENK